MLWAKGLQVVSSSGRYMPCDSGCSGSPCVPNSREADTAQGPWISLTNHSAHVTKLLKACNQPEHQLKVRQAQAQDHGEHKEPHLMSEDGDHQPDQHDQQQLPMIARLRHLLLHVLPVWCHEIPCASPCEPGDVPHVADLLGEGTRMTLDP